MKPIILYVTSLLVWQMAIAQDSKQYIVKGGTRPKDTFTFNDIYLYPSFTTGKVYFKNNHFEDGLMNYNRFTGEVDFITGKDTLARSDQQTIKNIAIGRDVFYYQIDIGYVQRVAETAYATLAQKETIQLADRRRQPNSATKRATLNGSSNNVKTTGAGVTSGLSLNVKEKADLIYRRKTDYYFGNAKGLFLRANKTNLMSLYPDRNAVLNSYFEDHDVDFSDVQTLRNLFTTVTETLPCRECKKIFNGKDFEGWIADTSTWSVIDGAMRGYEGSSRLAYTKESYGSFRLIFTGRMNPKNNDHLGVLFWGNRPENSASPMIDMAGWIQFIPPQGVMWDYHPPHHHFLPCEQLAKGTEDCVPWSTTEILCNLEKGTMRAAVDGVELCRYTHAYPSERTDPEKRIIAGPIGMFRHGNGASEYKDIYLEVDPKEDKLLTVK